MTSLAYFRSIVFFLLYAVSTSGLMVYIQTFAKSMVQHLLHYFRFILLEQFSQRTTAIVRNWHCVCNDNRIIVMFKLSRNFVSITIRFLLLDRVHSSITVFSLIHQIKCLLLSPSCVISWPLPPSSLRHRRDVKYSNQLVFLCLTSHTHLFEEKKSETKILSVIKRLCISFEEKEFVFQYLLITTPKECLQFLHFIPIQTKTSRQITIMIVAHKIH